MKDMLDINSASVEEIVALGVNPNLAENIVRHRDERGGFRSWDDLRDVPGIAEKDIIRFQSDNVII